jgi:hypothetical protein
MMEILPPVEMGSPTYVMVHPYFFPHYVCDQVIKEEPRNCFEVVRYITCAAHIAKYMG